MRPQLAVFGGSFDPPHVAHTLVAAYVLATQPVAGVVVVPTFKHPFDKQLTPFAHRVAMCRLAMSDLARAEVCEIEAALGGEGYTLHMIEALQHERPHHCLRLVIGSDLVGETPDWHNFERLRQLAPPIIVPRAGQPQQDPASPALPAISSTEIRHRLQAKRDTAGLLSPRVADYIAEHGLYAR